MGKNSFYSLTDFLKSYADSGIIRGHMPGHKGQAPEDMPELAGAYAMDITEIAGADSLFEAHGILLSGEKRTAAVYGSGACCWSAGGSTLCIQAMLAKMRAEHRTVIAGRTVHRAFLNSCVLLGLHVRWVFPEKGGIVSGSYAPKDFARALEVSVQAGESPCVYVTTPDYVGNQLPVRALSEVCRKYAAPLLVDHAHGSHCAFLPKGGHPIAQGADFCCDSFHKTLPALTGGAVLHCRKPEDGAEMKGYMQMFGSTSPSYLILQSLESCTAFLEGSGQERIRRTAVQAGELRERLSGKYRFLGTEPLHLAIAAQGRDLAAQLRKNGVECEYADTDCLVLLLSADFQDFDRLEKALLACEPKPVPPMPDLPSPAPQILSIREAALAPAELVPLHRAEGRICGPVQVPCPPAVPIAVSGEQLTKDWLALMEYYGMEKAAAVRISPR